MPNVKNMPWTTVVLLAILVVAAVVLIVFGNGKGDSTTLLSILIGAIPALFASGYAERNARDIRNGVLTEKAKEGATQALHETGVTQVIAAATPNNEMYSKALLALLDKLDVSTPQRNIPIAPQILPHQEGTQNGGQTV